MLTLDKIYHAKFVLKKVARKTDLIAAPRLCPGTDLYLKTENLQVTGSFKVRGAYYKISQLSEEERAKGVIACSAGNHAQGVALAATSMGIKSVVCMPDGAPIMKVESTKRLGAEVELVKGTYDDAHDRAVELQQETGMTFIHPYDDELVIAGQGTIGLEILDQLPDVDAVIVPIGGGGLISGVAFAIKSLRPEVKVYGVQAAGAPSMEHAFHDHKYETLDHVDTFADGIAVKTPGETTYEMVSQYVDDVVTVSEDEIAAAILALMENQKLVAEGAGATPVAAALFNKLPLAGKKTVCLISGGNIDVNILSRVITRGMVMSGRKTNLMIALEDKPGQLSLVSDIVSACGANVVSVHHDRSDANMAITSCFLKLGLETRDAAQIEQIKQKLTEAGLHPPTGGCKHPLLQKSRYKIKRPPLQGGTSLHLHTRCQQFHKLLGYAGAAAAGAQGKSLAFDEQLVAGHLHAVLLGQLQQNGVIAVFIRLLEGHRQAESRRQAHQLLAGIGGMQVVATAVAHAFLDQMAAVAGGVHGHVVAAAAHAALQNGFQRGKVVVVGREAQVVDEQNELQRILRQLVHQGGDLVQLVLLHLNQPQAVRRKLVGNGLDRAGFARTGVAVQQHIVGGLALQQGAGVGNDLFPLPLVAGQFAQALGIGVAHRHKAAILDGKHMVAGKHAVALLAHGRAARLVGGCIVGVRAYLPPRQKGRGFGAKVIQPSSAKLLQKFQFVFQCLFQHRPGIPAGSRAQAEILVLQHGVQQDFGPVGALGKQGAFKGGHRAGQPGSICRQSRAQRG